MEDNKKVPTLRLKMDSIPELKEWLFVVKNLDGSLCYGLKIDRKCFVCIDKYGFITIRTFDAKKPNMRHVHQALNNLIELEFVDMVDDTFVFGEEYENTIDFDLSLPILNQV